MKKTITFDLTCDDVRAAVAEFILTQNVAVRFELSDINFADPTDATKIIGVAASVTAVEEGKKSGAVSRKKASPSPAGSTDPRTESPSSGS